MKITRSIWLCFFTLSVKFFAGFNTNSRSSFLRSNIALEMDSWAEALTRSVVIFPGFGRLEKKVGISVCLLLLFLFMPVHSYLSVGEDGFSHPCLLWTQSSISSQVDVVSLVELLGFSSCLFWLDSWYSGAVLTGLLVMQAFCVSGLPVEVATSHMWLVWM